MNASLILSNLLFDVLGSGCKIRSMSAELTLVTTLMTVVRQMANAADPKLAAVAADEHVALSRRLAALKHAEADALTGAAQPQPVEVAA